MNNDFTLDEERESKQIDIVLLLRTIVRYWWVFAASVFICLGCSFVYNRYKPKVYSASMSILLKEERSPMSREVYQLTEGFGLSQEMENLDNQRYILSSQKMIGRTIDKLDFDITYYSCGTFTDAELYGPQLSFKVLIDSTHIQPIGAKFTVNFLDDGKLLLKVEGDEVFGYDYTTKQYTAFEVENVEEEYITEFDELLTTQMFSFRIVLDGEYNENAFKRPLAFKFNSREALINNWTSALNIEMDSKEGTRAVLSVVGYNYAKLIVFLQTLYDSSLSYNLDKKNETATRTLSFIKSQIISTADSLRVAADRLRLFKTKHNFAGSTQFAAELQHQFFDKEKGLQELLTQDQYLALIEQRLREGNAIEDYLATSISINNAILQRHITELVTLQSTLNTIRDQSDDNPYKKQLIESEEILRSNLKSLVLQTRAMLGKQIEGVEKQISELLNLTDKQPAIEAEYLSLQREYTILDGIYTFLLKKESETMIAKASNVSDSEVLQDPTYNGVVAPRTRKNHLLALLLGFALPLAFFLVKEYYNKKIRSIKELKRTLPDIPIVGMIPWDDEVGEIPSYDHRQSVASESFRTLRAKLNFVASESKTKTILISSCNAGEGKTFCAVNSAISFALSGKKTVIVNYDLRCPRTEKVLGIDRSHVGVTEYLIGQAKLDDIICQCLTDNLFLIPAGAIPPNPAELIGNKHNEELLRALREEFDIILLDTAPIGSVADAQLLIPFADLFLFVVRANRVEYDHLTDVVAQIQDSNMQKLYSVFNGATPRDREYKYYSRGYNSR